MTRIDNPRSTDVTVALCVTIGVGAAGIYDFYQGQAPQGLINPGTTAALVIFLTACATTVRLATLTGGTEPGHRRITRRLLLLASNVPSLAADPTYSCLLIAAPPPNINVLVLTTFEQDGFIRSALQAGAIGYLTKHITAENLTQAIISTSTGIVQLTQSVAASLIVHKPR